MFKVLPNSGWVSAAIYRYRLPFIRPIAFAGQLCSYREGMLFALGDKQGRLHWGEVAPLPGFSHETQAQAYKQLRQALSSLLTNNALNIDKSGVYPSVAFGLSCAQQSLQSVLPVSQTALLLQGTPAQILLQWQQQAARLSRSANVAVKLKVARFSLSEELELIRTLVQITPGLLLHLDANRGWRLPQAIAFGQQLPKHHIRYIEEPLMPGSRESHYAELEQFYCQTGVHYGLDETLQTEDYQFSAHPGLVMQVIKPTLVGSVERCCGLIASAKKRGVGSTISSSFESDFGVGLLNQMALTMTPAEPSGLDTLSYMDDHLVQRGQLITQKLTKIWELHA